MIGVRGDARVEVTGPPHQILQCEIASTPVDHPSTSTLKLIYRHKLIIYIIFPHRFDEIMLDFSRCRDSAWLGEKGTDVSILASGSEDTAVKLFAYNKTNQALKLVQVL